MTVRPRISACILGGLSGVEEQHAIYDLTVFLTTAKASEALIDFFSSGEQTSDRVRTINSVQIDLQLS